MTQTKHSSCVQSVDQQLCVIVSAATVRRTNCVVLQVTDRLSADRLVIIAPKEWEEGTVRVKDLKSREEGDVTLQDLIKT